MTYPPIIPHTPQPATTQEVEIQAKVQTPTTLIETDTSRIIKQQIKEPQRYELVDTNQRSTDNQSTEVQRGSLGTENDHEEHTEEIFYQEVHPHWNAFKIMRQSPRKGNTKYLVRWEDRNYPDTVTDDSNVNDELKRVFYLTHTKTGARRKKPLENTEHQTLAVIKTWDARDVIQDKNESLNQAEEHTHQASTENDAPQIIDSHKIDQPSTNNDSTKVQHGKLKSDNKDEDNTENIVYHDEN